MDGSTRFRINAPRVIHEPFEHEVIVVNLDTGRYYCLQRTGVDLWNGLMGGASIDEIVRAFVAAYDESETVVRTAVVSAMEDLKREELVVDAAGMNRPEMAWRARESHGTPFVAPALETYTDMQDLLLLDPIHEVDEAGWPVPAERAGKGESSDPQ
jgi:hypothetical protein